MRVVMATADGDPPPSSIVADNWRDATSALALPATTARWSSSVRTGEGQRLHATLAAAQRTLTGGLMSESPVLSGRTLILVCVPSLRGTP